MNCAEVFPSELNQSLDTASPQCTNYYPKNSENDVIAANRRAALNNLSQFHATQIREHDDIS